MSSPSPGKEDQELIVRDLHSGWIQSAKCAWTNTTEHSNELYDQYGVGKIKNVLCLRLFASSLYEIANNSKDPRKMMSTIFGDDLLRNIAGHDMKIYESIMHTVKNLTWKIRKAQILVFRRTKQVHNWKSVREILLKILCNEPEVEKTVAGMSATILQDIFRWHVLNVSFREDFPLLTRNRFNDVFRVAFLVFNDSIGDYLQKENMEVVYEMVASRLVYFYTRLAADTWRILVVRNGPKEQTEWFMLGGVEDESQQENTGRFASTSRVQSQKTFNHNDQSNISSVQQSTQAVSHKSFMNQFANQRPLRKY